MTLDRLDLMIVSSVTVPGQVRVMVQLRLAEWGMQAIADDVELIASELTTNAVERTPIGVGEVGFRLWNEGSGVLLAVWDNSNARPEVKRRLVELSVADIGADAAALNGAREDRLRGWGLPIVEALSTECGVHATPPHGKWVWARVEFNHQGA